MKWMSLKTNHLPLIMQEVDTVTEQYINILNELRKSIDETRKEEFNKLRDAVFIIIILNVTNKDNRKDSRNRNIL